jgi:hypothetical protein
MAVDLSRQARAALGAAARDDGTAGACAHADTKAVGFGTLAGIRLERSFHDSGS